SIRNTSASVPAARNAKQYLHVFARYKFLLLKKTYLQVALYSFSLRVINHTTVIHMLSLLRRGNGYNFWSGRFTLFRCLICGRRHERGRRHEIRYVAVQYDEILFGRFGLRRFFRLLLCGFSSSARLALCLSLKVFDSPCVNRSADQFVLSLKTLCQHLFVKTRFNQIVVRRSITRKNRPADIDE